MTLVECNDVSRQFLWFSSNYAGANSIYGVIFIGCGSIGNKITCKRWWLPIFGIAFVLMFTVRTVAEIVRFWGYKLTASFVSTLDWALYRFYCLY